MTQERMAVHVRQGPLPRFQTPSRIHVVDDEGAVLAWLARPAFDPREEAVLLRKDVTGLRLADGYRRGGASPRIEVVSYAPTSVVLRYETSEPTPLLMADTFHPGWTAEVSDGAELPVVRADHALRMVMLPEGEGTLTFSFWPSTLTLGLASAGAGVLVLLLWGAVRRRDPLMT
jgi:hypothetical protein